MQSSPHVITISRQLGSGGSYIGQRLAERLGMMYIDREILRQASEKLKLLEQDLENREERVASFWQYFAQTYTLAASDIYMPPKLNILSDQLLYEVEAGIIERIAAGNDSVIVGRGGSHILRKHPKHFSVFVYADCAVRRKRLQELYKLSEKEAKKMVEVSDRQRSQYYQTVTGQVWTDARQYHMAIDTSIIGMDNALEIIYGYIKVKFEDMDK